MIKEFYPVLAPAICACVLGSVIESSWAAGSEADEDWQNSASIYLWAAGVEGETALGNDIDIDFDEVLQNLTLAFMADIEMRKSRWSVLADFIYLDLEDEQGVSYSLPSLRGEALTIGADGNVEITAQFLYLFGGYSLWDTEQGRLDVVLGARYFDLELELKIDADVAERAGSVDLSPSVDVLDGVVGVRGLVILGEHWYLPYHADIGTGQSDLTFQVLAGVSRRFGWGDLNFSYRYIEWSFGSNSDVDNFNLNGPLLAAKFHF